MKKTIILPAVPGTPGKICAPGWILILILAAGAGLLAAQTDSTVSPPDKAVIRETARKDAAGDFRSLRWMVGLGCLEFGAYYILLRTDLMPDYPYRKKSLEVLGVTGVAVGIAYYLGVAVPVHRQNQIVFEPEVYRQVYTQEYISTIKHLRIFNTFTGVAVSAMTYVFLKTVTRI